MKKFTCIILAIAAAMTVSCQKEIGQIQIEEPEKPSENQITDGIPSEITAYIANDEGVTKTAYSPQGEFSWVNSDQVRLITTKDLSTFTTLDYATYSVSSLENGGKMAHFTGVGNSSDLPNFPTDGEWKSTGIAIYPTGLTRQSSNSDYGFPYIKLPQSVKGTMDEIVLTGVAKEGLSTFKFSTATSVLKLTVKDIPANAKQIRLYTNNKDSYPIDGDFMLKKGDDGIVTIHNTDYKKYSGGAYHSANDYIYVSLSGESSKTIYLNLPVAEYPAGTLSLKICDENEGLIMKRDINQVLKIERNECLEVPELKVVNKAYVGGGASTPRFRWEIDSKQVRIAVNKSSSFDASVFGDTYFFTNNSEKRFAYTATGFPEGYALTAISPSPFSEGSGLYYLHYVILSNTTKPTDLTQATNVVESGTVPFYYLSSSDATNLVGEYTASQGAANWWGSSSHNTVVKIAASPDATKGCVALTHFLGRSYDLTEMAGGQSASNKAGSPVYGTISGSTLTFLNVDVTNNEDGYFFKDYTSQPYFVAGGDSAVAVGSGKVSAASDLNDFSYTIDTSNGTVLTNSGLIVLKFRSNSDQQWTRFWTVQNQKLTKNN